MDKFRKAILALKDGTIFEGLAIGAEGETSGEVVFNTSITGYQEILTDPSYSGQLVTMTYTEQGNYGTNPEDIESHRPWAGGLIVKEAVDAPSSWRARESLSGYLKANNIVGIAGIDTRALTRRIRSMGAIEGVISTCDLDPESLVKKAMDTPTLTGRDLVQGVTCKEPYSWTQKLWDIKEGYSDATRESLKYKVVAYDFGIKYNILRHLVDSGCDVTVVPAGTSAKEVLSMNPDGIFLSNGPGDP
ncbi:MAG: carbamoyl phosphate synthase small subunit, partial [Deltaproteobacteria bacterium]|nr:carbamoyl phosphate synthase small subunit [Deltaproteobacteria bacterium]